MSCCQGIVYDLFCALYCCSCCRFFCCKKTTEEIEIDEMDDGYSVITSTTAGY